MIEMIHPDMANVPKKSIKAKLATMFKSKEEAIALYGLKTKFGGGRSTGFALIYDSTDGRKKYDSKMNLKRVSSTQAPEILILYLIGRFPRQAKERKKAKKGNQGKSQKSQRCCQGKGCPIWRKEEVIIVQALPAYLAVF